LTESASPFVTLPQTRVPVIAETEVLVVGGGSAGLAAAVAAARNGADVLLVERYGYLGGLASGGLIILLLTLDDGAGNQVVAGLCQEMVDRLEKRGAVHYPPRQEWKRPDPQLVERYTRWGLVWGQGPHRVRYSVAFEPHEFIFAADQMVRETSVRLLFHTWACEPIIEGDRIGALVVQNKGGRGAITARVVIDTTGDGDVFAAAAQPYEKEQVHPWLWFLMSNVQNVDEALASGKGLFFRTLGQGRVLIPWGGEARSPLRIDATNPDDLTRAELECRRLVMEEADRLKTVVPSFEEAYVSLIAHQLGITESRRLTGEYVLRREDLGRAFPDTVARTGHWTKYDCVYNIPYRSLLPRGLANLLVAGRCISVDHRTHHATKEIPACMATGEATGTAAALAARQGIGPKELDVPLLQKRLREQGASLG
jgi:2-polyprenyl-6-methoxyphenol hydroxylase-like FAD-dependent oxidoreductase